jgi:hypothetical protein
MASFTFREHNNIFGARTVFPFAILMLEECEKVYAVCELKKNNEEIHRKIYLQLWLFKYFKKLPPLYNRKCFFHFIFIII